MTKSTKPRLTRWFSDITRPRRNGVYEVKNFFNMEGRTFFAYFDGEKFGFRAAEPDEAFRNRYESTQAPKMIEWRGLVNKPK